MTDDTDTREYRAIAIVLSAGRPHDNETSRVWYAAFKALDALEEIECTRTPKRC